MKGQINPRVFSLYTWQVALNTGRGKATRHKKATKEQKLG